MQKMLKFFSTSCLSWLGGSKMALTNNITGIHLRHVNNMDLYGAPIQPLRVGVRRNRRFINKTKFADWSKPNPTRRNNVTYGVVTLLAFIFLLNMIINTIRDYIFFNEKNVPQLPPVNLPNINVQFPNIPRPPNVVVRPGR